MRVLGISTSTSRGSAAVVEDGRLLGAAAYVDLQGHAERIFGAIDEALAAARITASGIDALACDVGPGSFTGVRVGVAAAKGIALALGLRVAPVGSLEAMAACALGAGAEGALMVPMIDARKGEIFAAVYDSSLKPRLPPRHLPRSDVPALLRELAAEGRLILLGEVAAELDDLPADLLGDRSGERSGDGVGLPDAASVARRGLVVLDLGPCDPADLEPLYVRAPDAKLAVTPLG